MGEAVPIEFELSEEWRRAFPGACAGLLQLSGIENREADAALDALLERTAAELRARYGGIDRAGLLSTTPFAEYAAYYRRWDKTYHVLLQLESVLRGKPIRGRGTLVGAMFRAELSTGLLTAGHDASLVSGRIVVDVVRAGDRYTGLGGREIEATPGDMAMRDATGIVSSVLYGPDDRTQLSPGTTEAVFATYAPSGIGSAAVSGEFALIVEAVRTVSPQVQIVASRVLQS